MALVGVQMLGCAPSAFDDLKRGEAAAECDTGCMDASLVDASPAQPDAATDSGALHDAMVTPSCVCQAGDADEQLEPCGLCGSGVHSQTRSCDGCQWGAWSEWSACEGEHAECDPAAAPETQTVNCTTCGSRTQSRTCSAETCTWSAWTDTSRCTWCEQCAEVVYCDTPSNINAYGTWCKQNACSREQADDDCAEDAEYACGGITQPLLMQYL